MFNDTFSQGQEQKPPVSESLPDLCHKCGRCCKSATTFHSYKELQRRVELGEEGAMEFLRVFQPFPSIEAARKAVPEQVDQVIRVLEREDRLVWDDLTFYHCRYVTEEGLCGIYEERPSFCKQFPVHGWGVIPPGCGFEGWQYSQRETQQAQVRKLKELQFQMEMLSPDGIHMPTRNMTLDELRASIADVMEPWVRFGAENW